MSLPEMTARARQHALQLAWRSRRARPGQAAWGRSGRPSTSVLPCTARSFTSVLPPGSAATISPSARAALVDTAREVLAGRYEMLGWQRDDLANPDWFFDPRTGRQAPSTDYAFRIDCRSTAVGDIKQVWELSRHHHLTVLAAAWYLTGEDEFAERVAAQLRSWWAENPFLVRRSLDERHRARDAADRVGVGAPSSRWLGRRRGSVRAQRAGTRPAVLAPDVPRVLHQRRLVREQPRHRRGCRAPGRQLRLPVVRRERPMARGGSRRSRGAAGPQHLRQRCQSGAGDGLPRVRRRARAGGGRGGWRGRPWPRRVHVAPALPDGRCRRRHRRRGGPGAAPG